jgi:hypothetical protein
MREERASAQYNGSRFHAERYAGVWSPQENELQPKRGVTSGEASLSTPQSRPSQVWTYVEMSSGIETQRR